MAKILFSSASGMVRLAKLQNQEDIAIPAKLSFDIEGNNTFKQRINAIIVMGSIRSAVTHQLTDTLGGDLFLTVFNKAPHQIQVSAYIFEDVCGEVDRVNNRLTIGVGSGSTGFAKLYAWWEEKNAFSSKVPIKIAFGDAKPIRAYLVGMSASIQAMGVNESFWAASLSLIGVPERTSTTGVRQIANANQDTDTGNSGNGSTASNGEPQTAEEVLASSSPVVTTARETNGDPESPVFGQITADGYAAVGKQVNGFFG